MADELQPDVWCSDCEVEWSSGTSRHCWVCGKLGTGERRARTVEELADDAIRAFRNANKKI